MPTLTGSINRPLQLLANTVVKSPTFLALAGEGEAPATTQQALSRFHAYDIAEPELPGGYKPEEHRQHRPFCLIAPAPVRGLEIEFETTLSSRSGGIIEWFIEVDVPPQIDGDGEALRSFTETLGAILGDIRAALAVGGDMGGLLNITKIVLVTYDRADKKERVKQGDHVWASLLVYWGTVTG